MKAEGKTMDVLINQLEAIDRYELAGRGTVYTGRAPFGFDKSRPEETARLMKRPWLILHPDASGKLWRCKGIESFAITYIQAGTLIGILVEEWEGEAP